MLKRDIAKMVFGFGTLVLATSTAIAAKQAEKPLNPAEVPSEYRKTSDVIDLNLLRKRIIETQKQVNIWIDSTYDFQFIYPSHLKTSRQFEPGYLQDGRWSWFGNKEQGHSLVSVSLPTTAQKTTMAEIRIGVSEDPDVVQTCRALPSNARPDSLKTVQHRGTTYTFFSGGDAAMNKSVAVQAYRTVYRNRCYSTELMVYGTDPDVLDPPDYAAMKPDEAMTRLASLWRQMDFTWLP